MYLGAFKIPGKYFQFYWYEMLGLSKFEAL